VRPQLSMVDRMRLQPPSPILPALGLGLTEAVCVASSYI